MVRATRSTRWTPRAVSSSPSATSARVAPGGLIQGTASRSRRPRRRALGAPAASRQGPLPGLPDARSHAGAGSGRAAPDELRGVQPRHDHAQVDAVQQRPADATHVALRLARRAAAGAHRIAVPATAAGVHGRDELQPRRVAHRTVGPHDLHGAVLERLAQRVEHVAVELGQLVEEQDAVMRLRHQPRPQGRAAAHHGRVGGRVVGAEEGPAEPIARGLLQAGHASDDGHLAGLALRQRRQQSGYGPRQQRLAGTRRAQEQQVVAAREGHLQGPAGVLLAAHVGQVRPGAGVTARSASPGPGLARPAAAHASRLDRPRRGWARGAVPRPPGDRAGRPPGAPHRPALRADDLHVRDESGLLDGSRIGTQTRRCPASRSVATMGSTPGTGMTPPSSESSPSSAQGPPEARICSEASRMPMAMATS